MQPWVILDSPEALDAAIWAVRRTPRPEAPLATALGDALSYGLDLMADAPHCDRRVIDVAGDGRNNEGISVARTYEREDFTGITVNGLAVGEHEADIVQYYQDELIRGPGAFVEVAPRQTDYPHAIRRKLLARIAGPDDRRAGSARSWRKADPNPPRLWKSRPEFRRFSVDYWAEAGILPGIDRHIRRFPCAAILPRF